MSSVSCLYSHSVGLIARAARFGGRVALVDRDGEMTYGCLLAAAERAAAESGHEANPGEPGEIQVRGDVVFSEYRRRPVKTVRSFNQGWFRTGRYRRLRIHRLSHSRAEFRGYHQERGIQGLRIGDRTDAAQSPALAECAVVGVLDPNWGERVFAAICWRCGEELRLEELRSWAKVRLAVYKVPSNIRSVNTLPRNAMGKVSKKELAGLFAASSHAAT